LDDIKLPLDLLSLKTAQVIPGAAASRRARGLFWFPADGAH